LGNWGTWGVVLRKNIKNEKILSFIENFRKIVPQIPQIPQNHFINFFVLLYFFWGIGERGEWFCVKILKTKKSFPL
jgi:hypothetical protein